MAKDKDQMEHRNPDGTFKKGYKPKSNFGDRPQDRGRGSWHKEDTPRYKMERIINMTDDEVENVITDPSYNSFEHSFANILHLARTATTIEEAERVMKILEKMVDQVYGKMPTMEIKVEADDDTAEEASKFIRGFCLP